MNINDPLPPHANGYAKNEVTGQVVAVQIVNGKCFYHGGEETEVIELGSQWKPVKRNRTRSIVLTIVFIALVACTYWWSHAA
jgi:hypothetical protein